MTIGLDDVIAAETVLSHVDGQAGRLIIRGRDLDTLAGHTSFEDALTALWAGVVDAEEGSNDALGTGLARALGEGRVRAGARFRAFAGVVKDGSVIETMRAFLSTLSEKDQGAGPAALVAASGVAMAYAVALSRGGALEMPAEDAGHAADLLRLMTGRTPSEAEAKALETYLVTVMDHGLNASTFAARVVASTEADDISAVIAALCALKGPLHGGAPGPVLDMLDAIAASGDARGWLIDAMDRGERLMGFGHRIYKTRDPRADVLKKALGKLAGEDNRLEEAEAVEREALAVLAERKPGRRLDVNVEFYTALLLDAVGVPRDGFTPVFAAGRVAGWIAHAHEQKASGRLIRPQSRYVGDWPEQAA
ncbi:citrate synthase [Cucumibacter marinus]|uniref:citrate synthase n=1 Tax=Cucumibacter marinus TaxID=1121252 RepID=UPI0004181440|nr:citrate synthase [Cucumibacter marinus]